MQKKGLFFYLDQALALVQEFRGGYSNKFIGAEAFAAALGQAISEFKAGNYTREQEVKFWFAPTCSWDDFTHRDDLELGNTIYEQWEDLWYLEFVQEEA